MSFVLSACCWLRSCCGTCCSAASLACRCHFSRKCGRVISDTSSSTPLRPYEWVLSLLSMSLIRVLLGIVPAALLAIPLYHYSIFSMGLPLVAFFAVLLVMGWALGMGICGLILRQGLGAEGLAWTIVFTISPLSAV